MPGLRRDHVESESEEDGEDARPLQRGGGMSKVDNGEEDGKEFSGGGDDGEVQRTEGVEHAVNEDLSYCARQ